VTAQTIHVNGGMYTVWATSFYVFRC
jgi:hypothetical protein